MGRATGSLSPGDSPVEMPFQACTCVCQEARARCRGSDYCHEPVGLRGAASSKEPAFEESAWPWES